MRWLRFFTSWTFILGWTWLFRVVNGDLVIIRKVNKKDNYHKDRFNIRRSKCIDIRQGNKCGFYGGFERSPNNPCKCHCPPRRGTIIKRNKRWRCTSNEVFRQREGCGIYLLYESSDSFVKILSGTKWQSFHAATSGCNVKRKKSSYLSCNGSWTIDPYMGKFVDFLRKGFDQVARGYAYQIRIRRSPILEGKLIKLHLKCSTFGGNPCLLVKMKGKQNCYKRKKSINRIQLRKNFKKNAHLFLLPSLTSTSNPLFVSTHDFTNLTQKVSGQLESNLTETQGGSLRTEDIEVTTTILTITAALLGLIVLGLAVNLFCSSARQETFKEKHIFRRKKHHRILGPHRLRTSSDVTSSSHSISHNVEVSSQKSERFSVSTLYETDHYDSKHAISANIAHGGVS